MGNLVVRWMIAGAQDLPMMRKPKFKCDCGHLEDEHNWDAYSAFFGCCEKTFLCQLSNYDGSYELSEEHCPCNMFRIDNLRFLEETYVSRRHDIS